MRNRSRAPGKRAAPRRHAVLLPCLVGLLAAVPALEASGDCSDLGLPPVWVTGLDADGRYTGKDIGRGLEACSELGGCTLTLLEETYDDVAIFLHQPSEAWDCTDERTVCSTVRIPAGSGFPLSFSCSFRSSSSFTKHMLSPRTTGELMR